jgi:hypothetical protein
MSMRKPARIRKARSTSKLRSKEVRSRIAGHDQTRANSKQWLAKVRLVFGRGTQDAK